MHANKLISPVKLKQPIMLQMQIPTQALNIKH